MTLPVSVSINIPGKHLDKTASELLMLALGPSLTEIGAFPGDSFGIVRDPVSAFREKNQKRISSRSLAKMEASGVDPENARQLPMREAIAIVQGISDVDQPELSELWSGLIASARESEAGSIILRHDQHAF